MRHVLEFLFDRHTHFKLAGGDALFMRRLAGIKCFLTQVLSREEEGEEDTAAAADSEGRGRRWWREVHFFAPVNEREKSFGKSSPPLSLVPPTLHSPSNNPSFPAQNLLRRTPPSRKKKRKHFLSHCFSLQ